MWGRSFRKWFARRQTPIRNAKNIPHDRKKVKPAVELLETRLAPATLYVDSTPTIGGAGNDSFTATGGSQVTTGGLTLNSNLFDDQRAISVATRETRSSPARTANSSPSTVVDDQGNKFGLDARTRDNV